MTLCYEFHPSDDLFSCLLKSSKKKRYLICYRREPTQGTQLKNGKYLKKLLISRMEKGSLLLVESPNFFFFCGSPDLPLSEVGRSDDPWWGRKATNWKEKIRERRELNKGLGRRKEQCPFSSLSLGWFASFFALTLFPQQESWSQIQKISTATSLGKGGWKKESFFKRKATEN